MAAVSVALLTLLLWFVFALIFRLPFQFSIRSLLLLAVIVAIPNAEIVRQSTLARAKPYPGQR